jgi:hypothetical protein
VTERDWNGFWSWRDKPIGERGAAAEILQRAGMEVVNLVSRETGQDPPDCEAILDGRLSGVEVTELVHRKTLKRSIKAIRERRAGKEPKLPEAYFSWNRDDLLSALQDLIKQKDQRSKLRGGPYTRYVLIIHTNEFMLDRDTVDRLLQGHVFRTKLITDAVLGLSYHPSAEPSGGCYPVFRLNLKVRSSSSDHEDDASG